LPIRPIDIRRKEFKIGFRGYDANQVDDFLDAVADEFERNYTENQRMREDVSSLRDRLQQFEDLEGSIRAALVHAEQASNDLRRAATSESEDLRQSAQREADFTIREAKTRSHQMLADSSSRLERVQDSYEALQDAKKSFTNDFRHLLKTYMEMMDNMEVSSAREIEASLRDRLDTESIAVVREAAREEEIAAQEPAFAPTAVDPDEGELTGPGLTDLEPEEPAFTTGTGEVDPDATQLIETYQAAEEHVPVDEPAAVDQPVIYDAPVAADVVPEQSEAQETPPAADEQPTQVLRAEDMGPLSEPEPQEAPPDDPEVAEPEVEPSTVQDGTQMGDEPPLSRPEAADEVEREEPTLAEESGPREYFDGEQAEQGDSRTFRASRFLRRRD
jgi:cell division initiation protein